MHTAQRLGLIVLVSLVAACSGENEQDAAPASGEAGAPESEVFRENPDFGGVSTQTVEVEGVGSSMEEATLRALDSAIAQVNGRRVSSSSASATAKLKVDINGLRALDIDSKAFADLVVSSSDGAVRRFEMLHSEEISRAEAERSLQASGSMRNEGNFELDFQERVLSHYWRVRIRADVLQYEAPADDGRPSLVIAMPRHVSAHYVVGDERVAAEVVGVEVRRRLSDALAQSGRFTILDRELGPELQAEVDFINSGNARIEDVARLGQQMAADLVLIPSIDRFGYPRTSRQLRMSDRQLVSYAGGGSVSLRLVNAATGEVVLSESFAQELPATEPSTLPRSIDGASLARDLMQGLSDRMVRTMIGKIFPVSVIALSGETAVLSQGGRSVSVGEHYAVVRLGDDLVDPQSGRSLGRMELPCCTLRVDRVADLTAYGTLLDASGTDLSGFRPGMLELRAVVEPPTSVGVHAREPASGPERVSAVPSAAPASVAPTSSTNKAPAEDSDW